MQPDTTNPETHSSPTVTSPQSPLQPQPQTASTKRSSMKLALLISLFTVLIAGAIYGVYAWQHSQINTLNAQVTSLQAQLSKLQPVVNSNYRGGSNGVKLTENVDDQISQTLSELAIYKQQNGQYPTSDTAIMSQNYQRFGYDGIAAGPGLKCPQNIGYISYSGYTNPKTNQVDQFDLYYCDGSSVVHKTQADISATNN